MPIYSPSIMNIYVHIIIDYIALLNEKIANYFQKIRETIKIHSIFYFKNWQIFTWEQTFSPRTDGSVSESCNLKKNDVQLNHDGYLTIKVSASKTDQEGKSCTIFVYESNTSYSAIKWFTEYQKFISFVPGPNLFGIDQRRFRKILKN